MAKRYRASDLSSDDLRRMINEMLEFSDEERNDDIFSEESEEETISVGETSGTSGHESGTVMASTHLEEIESNSNEDSQSSDGGDDNYDENIASNVGSDWVENGQVRPRFVARFRAGVKGDFVNTKEPEDIFELFFNDEICELISRQTNIYAQQEIGKKSVLGKMKRRSRDKDWVPTNKEEIKLLFSILLLQGIIQKPTLGHYFSRNRLLATPIFFEIMTEKRFLLLLRFLHFADNESYNGQVPPKIYKVKPLLDHLIEKFQEAYTPNDKLSIDESLLLWKGRLGWKVYIAKKRSRFGMESYKLAEAKTGYVYNMLWYTGKDTQLKTEIHGIDISNCTKPTRVVFTLAENLLKQGYAIALDNYYCSPELFDLLNKLDTDAFGTVRSNRKGLPKHVMSKKLKQGEIAASYKDKLMALKWRDKREVCMLSSIHDASVVLVPDRKGGMKSKPKVCTEYNDAMGGVDLSDQYMVSYSSARKRMKKYYQKIFRHLLDLTVFNSYIIYRQQGGKFTHLQFRLHLIGKLIEKYGESVPLEAMPVLPVRQPPPDQRERYTGRHFPDFAPPTEKREHASVRCVMCQENKVRRRTQYRCNECDVALCAVPCFRNYHTQ